MNIAIVGSNGYIAGYLRKRLVAEGHIILKIDVEGVDVEILDLENASDFNYNILEAIDFIVFTAAVSGPDRCAEEFDLCWKINVEGTKHFIEHAVSKGCKVLFFSSDSVYGDIPGCIYNEESELKGTTAYGRMKRSVEEHFKEEPLFKAIRLSYVMSASDRFISYCLGCMKTGENADIFHPFYRNVISVSDVVDVVSWFAKNFDEYEPTALNVAGDELVSRVRMADELNLIYAYRLNYKVSKPDADFFKNRPMITHMKSLYLEKYGILKKESFTEKISKEMKGIEL